MSRSGETDRHPSRRRRGSGSNRGAARRLARQFVLMGLYQHQLSGAAVDEILDYLATEEELAEEFSAADQAYLQLLLSGAIRERPALEALFSPCLDRPSAQLDPIERGLLLLGALELRDHVDVPYRVIINEGIELAKRYGATESHRYINSILDRLAQELRSSEFGRR